MAHRAETDMTTSSQSHIGMYLVRYHPHAISSTDFCHSAQRFFAPQCATRVVGIAQNKPSALLGPLFKIIKVYFKAAFHHPQRTAFQLPLPISGQRKKWRIYRCGDQNPVARLAHSLQHKRYASHNARYKMQLFPLGINTIVIFQPVDYCVPITLMCNRIAEHLMPASSLQCFHHKIGTSEIHIRHPHRQQIIPPEKGFHPVMFHTMGALPLNNLVEIILHSNNSLSMTINRKPQPTT